MDVKADRNPLRHVLLLLSGGLDSTTCAALLIAEGYKVSAITYDYGQLTSSAELEAAKAVADHYGIDLTVAEIPATYWRCPLTGQGDVPVDREVSEMDSSVASTYVPHRNLQLLTIAAAVAYQKGINTLCIGVNAQDYSGYPDCRPSFIASAEATLSISGDSPIKIMSPLSSMSKADIVRVAVGHSAPIALTLSCYLSESPCGRCDSCLLRAKGFDEAGELDACLV